MPRAHPRSQRLGLSDRFLGPPVAGWEHSLEKSVFDLGWGSPNCMTMFLKVNPGVESVGGVLGSAVSEIKVGEKRVAQAEGVAEG